MKSTPSRSIALRVTIIFLIAATRATILGFPLAMRRRRKGPNGRFSWAVVRLAR
ncbi:MAG: hypothetical protein ACJAYU_004990 [Bradymonadia bacterium]